VIIYVSGTVPTAPVNVTINNADAPPNVVVNVTESLGIVLSVSGDGVPGSGPIDVVVPEYVRYANRAESASYASIAKFAETSLGTIENAVSSSYAQTASFVELPAGLTSSSVQVVNYISGTDLAVASVTASQIDTNKLQLQSNFGSFVLTGSYSSGILGVTETIRPAIDMDHYTGVTIEYIAYRDTSSRIGMVMGIWNDSTIRFTDISCTDIGDTTDLLTKFLKVNNEILFQVESAGTGSSTWTVQGIFKLFPKIV